MNVIFYNNKNPLDKVRKSSGLVQTDEVNNAILLDDSTLKSPVIRVARDKHHRANYLHIPAFGRWYFITSVEKLNDGTDVLHLACDVLYSWKDDILASTQFILRQQNVYNAMLIDGLLPRENNYKIEGISFGTNVLVPTASAHYILITQGSGEVG